jgi:hypothetical protein
VIVGGLYGAFAGWCAYRAFLFFHERTART